MDCPKPNLDAISESAIIESYLDDLCAPLHQMPQDAQDEIRQEIGAHLQSLIAMKREPERVLESALQQFGEPSEIGRLLALEWENRQWDLSGLSVPQRIEKLRELFAEEKRASNKKRNNWNRIVLMSMPTLLLTRSVTGRNNDWLEATNLAMYVVCVFSFVFFTVTALQEWQRKRVETKSAISCFRAFITQFNFALIGLFMVLPFGGILFYIALWTFYLFVALMMASSLLEPSRKSRLFATTALIMGGVLGLSLIAISTALQPLGVNSYWIQFFTVLIVSGAIRLLFLRRKTSKPQNAE